MPEPEAVYRRDPSAPDGKVLSYYRVYVWNPWIKKRERVVNPVDGSQRFPTPADARIHRDRHEAEMREQYQSRGNSAAPLHGNTKSLRTFREWSERWLAEQGGSENSQKTRRTHIEFALRTWHAADKPIDAITRGDLERLHQDMLTTPHRRSGTDGSPRYYSGHSISNYLSDIARCIGDAHTAGLRRDNPVGDFYVRGYAHREVRLVTDAELSALVELAHRPRRKASYAWLAPAFLVSHDCGLRAGEIAGLSWRDVHFTADVPYIVVRQKVERLVGRGVVISPYTKGKEIGEVPMTDRVVEALRTLQRRQQQGRKPNPHGLVFQAPEEHGRPISPLLPNRVLQKLWREGADEFGLEGEPPVWHHLRHATASKLARANAPAVVIKSVLRHKSLKTSQGYIDRLGPSQLIEWQRRSTDTDRQHGRLHLVQSDATAS